MNKQLIQRCINQLKHALLEVKCIHGKTLGYEQVIAELEAELEKPDPGPFIVDYPEYHYQGMGCGLEDRNIHDRYDAMRYGWDCAIDAIAEILPEQLYTSPPPREPLSDLAVNTELHIHGGSYHGIYKDGFRAGVKFAEKHHRIGVDNE